MMTTKVDMICLHKLIEQGEKSKEIKNTGYAEKERKRWVGIFVDNKIGQVQQM